MSRGITKRLKLYESKKLTRQGETLYLAGRKRYCWFSVSTVEYFDATSIWDKWKKKMKKKRGC